MPSETIFWARACPWRMSLGTVRKKYPLLLFGLVSWGSVAAGVMNGTLALVIWLKTVFTTADDSGARMAETPDDSRLLVDEEAISVVVSPESLTVSWVVNDGLAALMSLTASLDPAMAAGPSRASEPVWGKTAPILRVPEAEPSSEAEPELDEHPAAAIRATVSETAAALVANRAGPRECPASDPGRLARAAGELRNMNSSSCMSCGVRAPLVEITVGGQ